MTAPARILSRSHPGTFGFLFRQPAERGERWTVTVGADLPGLHLNAGDVLTVRPQCRWNCDCLYLLESGELARITFSDTPHVQRMVHQCGRVAFVPLADVHAQIVGRVEDRHDANGRRV